MIAAATAGSAEDDKQRVFLLHYTAISSECVIFGTQGSRGQQTEMKAVVIMISILSMRSRSKKI